MLDKAKRWQNVLQDYNFVELLNLCELCDNALSGASLFHNHCLDRLYPVEQQIHCIMLQRCKHNFATPVVGYQSAKNSFVK